MIEVKNLSKTFHVKAKYADEKDVHAVRNISLQIPAGGAVALIGESGCGKTTLGRIICGFDVPTSGTIFINGKDLAKIRRKEKFRVLQKIQIIHQDPYQALNPSHTVYQMLFAPLKQIAKQKKEMVGWIDKRMIELMELVGLDPATILFKYPHMLSGGQRQRIIIARALTVEPRVLIADEVVSMIDVSLRLGILKLLRRLREELHISILFITHDVASARYLGRDTQLNVIYKGMIVEKGNAEMVIHHPHHPYTQALLSAIPVLRGIEIPGKERFALHSQFKQEENEKGCLFADRCPFREDICMSKCPELSEGIHAIACYFPEDRQVTAIAIEK